MWSSVNRGKSNVIRCLPDEQFIADPSSLFRWVGTICSRGDDSTRMAIAVHRCVDQIIRVKDEDGWPEWVDAADAWLWTDEAKAYVARMFVQK